MIIAGTKVGKLEWRLLMIEFAIDRDYGVFWFEPEVHASIKFDFMFFDIVGIPKTVHQQCGYGDNKEYTSGHVKDNPFCFVHFVIVFILFKWYYFIILYEPFNCV